MSGRSSPFEAPDVGISKGVFALWKEGVLFDFTIKTDDRTFRVHKVIMASVSDYFKVMLTGGMLESHTDTVHLKGFNPLVVANMINYIYTGDFSGPIYSHRRASLEDLLSCSVYLQIPSAIDACTDLLLNTVDTHNCFSILATFKTFAVQQGIEWTMKYIKDNTSEVFSACEPNQVSYSVFLDQMDFRGRSEWENFVSVERWIQVNIKKRKQHLNDLLSHIRFALMTPTQLTAIKRTPTFTKSRGSWRDLVHKAISYHSLPAHQKVVYASDKQNALRSDPSPVCFPADVSSTCEFYAVHKGTSWTKHDTPPTPEFHAEPAAVLVVNDFLIICTAFDKYQRWHLFDPRTMEWSTMTGMVRKKGHFALVHCRGYLYAMGGCVGLRGPETVTDGIERYDFQTNSWRNIPSKLPVGLFKHVACVLKGAIYITGGWETIGEDQCEDLYNAKACSPRLDYFNPSTSTWVKKPPIPFPTQWTTVHVMNIRREQVVLVIGFSFRMQYFTPSTNQWAQLDEWLDDWTDGIRLLSSGSVIYTFHTERVPDDLDHRKLPDESDYESPVGYGGGYSGYDRWGSGSEMSLYSRSPEPLESEGSGEGGSEEKGSAGSISPRPSSDTERHDSDDGSDCSDEPPQLDCGVTSGINDSDDNKSSPKSDPKPPESGKRIDYEASRDGINEEGAQPDSVKPPHSEPDIDVRDSAEVKTYSPKSGPPKSPQSSDAKGTYEHSVKSAESSPQSNPDPVVAPQPSDADDSTAEGSDDKAIDGEGSKGEGSNGKVSEVEGSDHKESNGEESDECSNKSAMSDLDNNDQASDEEDAGSPRPESVQSGSSESSGEYYRRLLERERQWELSFPSVKPARPKPVQPSEWYGSAKWTLGKGEKFTECKLGDFPVCKAEWGDEARQYFCALLAFPPQTSIS